MAEIFSEDTSLLTLPPVRITALWHYLIARYGQSKLSKIVIFVSFQRFRKYQELNFLAQNFIVSR